MAIYDTQPVRPTQISARGKRFFWLVLPIGFVYIAASLVHHNDPQNAVTVGASFVTGAYVVLISAWFALIRREIPTVFTGRFQPIGMVYRGEAIFQLILIASFVVIMYVL